MRIHKYLRSFGSVLAVSWLAAGVSDAFAQPASKAPPSASNEAQATTDARLIYDLEIQGGILEWTGHKRKDGQRHVHAYLQNVVDLLRELHPEANFALSPGLAELTIADLKMRTSSVDEKLEALRIASGSDFNWRSIVPPIDPATSLQATPTLYILDSTPSTTKSGLQVEVFNIGNYLNSFSTTSGKGTEEQVRERLEQIEKTALEMVKEYETLSSLNGPRAKPLRPPSIKFHAGANLAVIMGEPEAVAVAAKMIGALPGAQRSVAGEEPSQRIDDAVRRLQRESAAPTPRR